MCGALRAALSFAQHLIQSPRPGSLATGSEDQRPDQVHPELGACVRLGVMLRCVVGVIFGVGGVTSGSVSMMPGRLVVTVLMMLRSFGVILGRLFMVFSGLLVVVRSLVVRHVNLHFSSRWWTSHRRLLERGRFRLTHSLPGESS